MARTDNLEFFKKVSILNGLTDTQLRKVQKISKRVKFSKGNVIMKEGEEGNTMYLFVSGMVEVLHTLTMKLGKSGFEETEKSMVKLDAKYVSFFGDMALLQKQPRSATITAVTDCILYEIKRDDFDRLCTEDNNLGHKILRNISTVLCERIRKSNADILKLTTALSIALSK